MTPKIPTITTLASVPAFARGFVRDIRPRWAFEKVGQPYEVILITDTKCTAHRRLSRSAKFQPIVITKSRSSSPARSCCGSPSAPVS